ncbi:hypothetical protein DFH09DRAFT_1174766 [Mycena vulgaris]|nr:hypothetical protein DFH09DRAFT_1174766 [Mycena vulgaris]
MAAASIRYPVLSLPAKIIAEIFIHCLPSDSSPSPSRAPLLLAQICRQWRIIALTTPSLWRSIHLEGRSTSKSSIQLLRTWLSRSKDQPLDCAFTSMDAVCADELVSSSLKNCDHWEEMNISIPVTGSSLAQLHLLDKKFPILQKLHIEYGPLVRRGIPEQIPQQLIRIVVKNAPLLRDVSISVASGHILRVNLPWTQLHTVSLDSPDFQDCIALLQCSPRLISLHLTISGQIPVTFPPVTLDSLQYLDVPATFLASLTCPNLRHLTLNFIVWEHIPLLNAFISRSSCAPTRMLFQGFASSDPETFRLIMCRLAPSIQELDLRLTRLNVRAEITQYMHAMTDAILPTLKVLRLSFEPRYDPDWDAILAVVAARRPPGASTTPLEEIELSTSTEPFLHPKIAILTAFRALQDGGLKVRISRAMRKEARQVLLDNLTN